jgi:spermidine synthase
LRAWLKDAQINRDGDLRLQYLAGMGLNLQQAGTIYGEILQQRKFPENLFIASDIAGPALRSMIGYSP